MPTTFDVGSDSFPKLAIDDQSQQLVTSTRSGQVVIWKLSELDSPPRIFQAHQGRVYDMALAAGGRWLISGSYYPQPGVRVWDLHAEEPGQTPIGLIKEDERYTSLQVTPDGEWLFVIGDRDLRIWRLNRLAAPPLELTSYGGIEKLAVSGNSRWLATSHRDKAIRVWDLTADNWAAKPQRVLHHDRAVEQLVLSADGRRLMVATGSEDPNVPIWDLSTNDPASAPLLLPKGFEGYVYGTQFTPDSKRLIIAGQDQVIRVWDLTVDDPAAAPTLLRGHDARIFGFAISADGRKLFTADSRRSENARVNDGIVRIWDLHDLATQPLTFKGGEAGVRKLAITHDGRWLVTADGQGRLHLWTLPIHELMSLASRTAGRNFSSAEWEQFFWDAPYRRTFPQLAVPDKEFDTRVSGHQSRYYGVTVSD